MSNTIYDNKIIGSVFQDNLTTAIDMKTLMKVDTDLAEQAGMVKVVNKYEYTGEAEEVSEGSGNSGYGQLQATPTEHRVKVIQHTFKYTDEEFMKDANVVDFGIKGAINVMINDITDKFYDAIDGTSTELVYTGKISYDTVVDAIAETELEDETQLVILCGLDTKAALRKDPDFKAVNNGEIIIKGHIGFLAGIPVVVSKKVEEGVAFVLSKEAVTLFIKKDTSIEQARDIEKRTNTIVFGATCVVALTDATKVVKIHK